MTTSFINLKFYRSIKLKENFTHYHFLINHHSLTQLAELVHDYIHITESTS
jgi:hypothetical protein